MKSSALCSSLLFLGLILISQSPSLANAARNINAGGLNISAICADSKDQVGCTNILLSDPKMRSAKNYAELAKLFLEMALAKAREAQTLMKGLAQTKPSPAMKECAENDYTQVVYSFGSALCGLTVDTSTSNYDAKVAGDAPIACESRLADEKLVIPEVDILNRQMSLLSNIGFLITGQLD